jgi:tRNA-2-methylthio-N6-dimethylallyladenosine synthase
MTDDLIDIYKSVPQLANQLHLPVQSGSDRVLKAMKRNYTADYFRDIVSRVKKHRPNIKVTSDFIVGFPGETHDEFMETMKLIEDIQFDSSFSFIYSPRPGTPASILEDNISKEEKKERLNILQNRLNEIQRGFSKKMEGSIQRCLVTGISKKRLDQLQARTECNRVINFPFHNISFIGKLVDIKVEKALAYSLLGSLHNTKELT